MSSPRAFRELIQHVQDAVIPASLLSRVRPDFRHSRPDPQVPVGRQQHRHRQAAVAKDVRPRRRRFAIPRHDRQNLLSTVAHRTDDDQKSGLFLFQPGFDIDSVRPRVHQLAVVQSSRAPGVVFDDPLVPQTSDRRQRQRRSRAQKTTQRQLEVTLGQTVQVQLRQQLTHLLSAASEQRQDGTLEALLQAPHPRTFYLDRAGRQRQLTQLPVSISVAAGRIQQGLALLTNSSQYVRDFLFQYRLHQLLNLRARPLLQCGERGHGHFGRARFRLWHGDLPLPAGKLPAL